MYTYIYVCHLCVCVYVCIACMHICKNVCKYLRISMYYTLILCIIPCYLPLLAQELNWMTRTMRAQEVELTTVSQTLTVLCDWVTMWMHIYVMYWDCTLCVVGGWVGVCGGDRCLCAVCMCVGVYVWVGAI